MEIEQIEQISYLQNNTQVL